MADAAAAAAAAAEALDVASDSSNTPAPKKVTPAPAISLRSIPIDIDSIPDANPQGESLADFQFCRLQGRAALVTKFVFDYLRPIPSFKEIETKLTANRKSAWSQGKSLISNNISKLQLFVRNRLFVKRITRDLVKLKTTKIWHRRDRASKSIQQLIRRYLSKVRVMHVAQMVYSKFVDGETDREYWYNNRTGQAFWTKPRLLGYLDCGLPVQTPLPSESCVVTCTVCLSRNANCFCHDCNQAFCNNCYPGYHRSERRKTHVKFQLDACVQCDFQVGTKLCASCKDVFCDTCFRFIHRKGRLRLHTFDWLTDSCAVCNERSCRWQVVDDRGINTFYCSICYPEYELNDGYSPDEVIQYPQQTTAYRYHGRWVKQYRKELVARQEKEERERRHAERMQEQLVIKRDRSALTIQRCWRGHHSRKHLSDFLKQRKQFYSVRLTEQSFRESRWYRLRAFFGLAPPLASDTPKERLLKMYPMFLHHIVAECIKNDWKGACAMLQEEEQYFPKTATGVIKRPNWFTKQQLKADLVRHRQRLVTLEKELELKLAVFANAKQTFRDVSSITITITISNLTQQAKVIIYTAYSWCT